jgi:cytoskeleton protein RodZ
MSMFTRSAKPDGAGDPPDGEAGAAAARHTIGELLRQTRESYGGEIDRIAATLRIRAAYLTAIEESRYSQLPGPVYALGFVRAYANHLGLDGEEAVRRFKQEATGFEIPRDLTFPVPLSERSIPGGTMLLAAFILAICGYGLWYYLSTGERARPERVAAVPPELVVPPSPPPAAVAPPAPPPPASGDAAAPSENNDGPTVPPPPFVTGDATPPQPPAALPPNPAVSSTPAPPAPSPAPTIAAAPATPPSPPVAAPAPADQGRVFGAVTGPSRVSLRAEKDSWVQIRDGNQVVSERVLHAGDTLRVADKGGQVLATGNAAALDVTVDGRKAPALTGTIRHAILLNPDRLLAGTAILLPPEPPAPNQAAAPPPAAAPAPAPAPATPGVMQPVGN